MSRLWKGIAAVSALGLSCAARPVQTDQSPNTRHEYRLTQDTPYSNKISDFLLGSSFGNALLALFHKRVLCETTAPQKKPHSQPHMVQPPTFKERPAEAPIYRIVLTGGPCGGKTTAITTVSEQMKDRGFNVYVVPEAATLLMTGGVPPLVGGDLILFQESIIKVQMRLEEVFFEIATSTGKPSIIICDRGTMDSCAYVSALDWQAILDRNEWTNVRIRDGRYDAVIHLVTAAIGAEGYYTTANNNARMESADEAVVMDLKTREAWSGHPHLRIVDNSTDFNTKINRVVDDICILVGVPPSDRIVKKKYLLSSEPQWSSCPVHAKTFEVEQTFLTSSDGSEMSVSRRGQTGSYSYTLRIVKEELTNGVISKNELKRKISSREYVSYLTQRDTSRGTIRLTHHCFLWKNTYYVVDSVYNLKVKENGDLEQSPNDSDRIHIVRIEMDKHEADKIHHPDFLSIQRDVTTDTRYKFVNLSLRQK